MKRKLLYAVVVAPFLCASAFADDVPQDVKLVYPVDAAVVEQLDSSTPAKRATPPTAEESELDPVTPIGQIRTVVNALSSLEDGQRELSNGLRDVVETAKNASESVKDVIEATARLETAVNALSAVGNASKRSGLVDLCVVAFFAFWALKFLFKGASYVVELAKEQEKARNEKMLADAYARVEREMKQRQEEGV